MSTSTLVAGVPATPCSQAAGVILDRARVGGAAGFIMGVFLAFLGFC